MKMAVDKSVFIHNFQKVLQRIAEAYAIGGTNPKISIAASIPRLVAVSKTFPVECIFACYEAGQRHFGENYLHELTKKSLEVQSSCPNIRWHYIGKIQSNKILKLCETPNLWCIETLCSIKHSDILQRTCVQLGLRQLNVFIQVNTSGETNKGGVTINPINAEDSLLRLAEHVVNNCPNLKFLGLMTIGSVAQSLQNVENQDFTKLVEARLQVCNALNISNPQSLELSMGMSQDFETAVHYGATNVRVGSTIFGHRNYV